MGLSITLVIEETITKEGTGVFMRKDGGTVELTIDEVREHFPNATVNSISTETNEVFYKSITHNLVRMAEEAGLYDALWRPYRLLDGFGFKERTYLEAEYEFEEENTVYAYDIIDFVENGLKNLLERPEYFEKYNPSNGWGSYDGLVSFATEYLDALKKYPEAIIEVSR